VPQAWRLPARRATPVRWRRRTVTVSPSAFPIFLRISALIGSLCVPSPRAMNELRNGSPSTVPFTFARPFVPKYSADPGTGAATSLGFWAKWVASRRLGHRVHCVPWSTNLKPSRAISGLRMFQLESMVNRYEQIRHMVAPVSGHLVCIRGDQCHPAGSGHPHARSESGSHLQPGDTREADGDRPHGFRQYQSSTARLGQCRSTTIMSITGAFFSGRCRFTARRCLTSGAVTVP
jgi:hypothetical protein